MNNVRTIFNYNKYKGYIESDGFVQIFNKSKYPLFLLALFFTIFLIGAIFYYYSVSNVIDTEYLYFIFVMVVICYVLRFKTDYKRSDRIILFLIFYYLFRFVVGLSFVLGSLLVYSDQRDYWIYPFILGICWLPTFEFIKKIQPVLNYFLVLRLLITLFVVYTWIKN